MESLMAGFFQFFRAITEFLSLEGRLDASLCLHLILRLSGKSEVFRQLVRQCAHPILDSNDLVLFNSW